MTGPRNAILREIHFERLRQEDLCTDGKFSCTCAHINFPIGGKLCVLAEEFGEVSKLACELYDPSPGMNEAAAIKALRTELIHVAAVAVAWIESIDAEEES